MKGKFSPDLLACTPSQRVSFVWCVNKSHNDERRSMRRIFLLAITLFVSGMVMSCGGGDGSGEAESHVVMIRTAGSVSPAYMYQETVTIENESMHIERTGGNQIIVGEWDVTITQKEADDIKSLSGRINPVTDKDIVSDMGQLAPLGAGLTEIHISDSVYYNGRVDDPTTSQSLYHTFSPNVRNLADYIDGLIAEYGFNMRDL
jgi:hypothetical protein